jgi:hypothetical protein
VFCATGQKAILHLALGQPDVFLEAALPLFDRDPFFSIDDAYVTA